MVPLGKWPWPLGSIWVRSHMGEAAWIAPYVTQSSTLIVNNTLLSCPLIMTKSHSTYPSFDTSNPKSHSHRHQLKTQLQMDSHAQFINSLGKPSIWRTTQHCSSGQC